MVGFYSSSVVDACDEPPMLQDFESFGLSWVAFSVLQSWEVVQ